MQGGKKRNMPPLDKLGVNRPQLHKEFEEPYSRHSLWYGTPGIHGRSANKLFKIYVIYSQKYIA